MLYLHKNKFLPKIHPKIIHNLLIIILKINNRLYQKEKLLYMIFLKLSLLEKQINLSLNKIKNMKLFKN
jgi:hypothetical protein